ncbi:hypothetical protein M8J77_023618 [Diaphorina citri]|nr:hypothetical protein M8J77_023618 [Diaphorina citri]
MTIRCAPLPGIQNRMLPTIIQTPCIEEFSRIIIFPLAERHLCCNTMDHEDSKTQRLEHFTVDKLPIEIWEKILMHLDCDSWNNLSKTFDIIQGVIHSIKKKEVERCKKILKRIPFEHFLELQEMSTESKKVSKTKIIETYVNQWKFHSIDKVKLKPIQYSDEDVVVDYLSISGQWIFLYTKPKTDAGVSGFKMIHLHSLVRHEEQLPWLYVEKFTFLQSADFDTNSCHKLPKVTGNCWCGRDLTQDYMQVHLPLNKRILQGGLVSNFVQLHPFQAVNINSNFSQRNFAKTGDYYATCGKFKLIFEAHFDFEEESFKTRVKTPRNHTYVFEGDPAAPGQRKRLLDVSVYPVPNSDTFRAILHILDQKEAQYKLILLVGMRVLMEIKVPTLIKSWLFRGSLLLGICSAGNLFLANHKGKFTDSRKPGYYTAACLRVNLLALGTRCGQLLLYRLTGKTSNMFFDLNFRRPYRELRICTESIAQVMFAPTSGPEILVLTALNKLYHVKL